MRSENLIETKFRDVPVGRLLIVNPNEALPTVYTKTKPHTMKTGLDAGRVSEMTYREAWMSRAKRAFFNNPDGVVYMVKEEK